MRVTTLFRRLATLSVATSAALGACAETRVIDPVKFCQEVPTSPLCQQQAGGQGGGSGGNTITGGAGGAGGSRQPCDLTTVVIVAAGYAGPKDKSPANACSYGTFDEGWAAKSTGTTKVVVYGDQVASAAAVTVPANLSLEGYAADRSKPVALTISTTTALVTLSSGASLQGFALDGGGTATGIVANAGNVTVKGPLTLRKTTVAIDLLERVVATIQGDEKTPILLTENQVGVRVAAKAGLTLQGDGKTGVTVEKTSKGAGVLVLNGGTDVPVVIDAVGAQDNQGSGDNGTGAIEVQQGRQVALRKTIFKNNRRSITLNGKKTSSNTDFINVSILNNQFANPADGTGVAICGSQLGADPTALNIGAGNSFPKTATCSALAPAQQDSCNTGGDLGHDTPNKFAVTCVNLNKPWRENRARRYHPPAHARAGGRREARRAWCRGTDGARRRRRRAGARARAHARGGLPYV